MQSRTLYKMLPLRTSFSSSEKHNISKYIQLEIQVSSVKFFMLTTDPQLSVTNSEIPQMPRDDTDVAATARAHGTSRMSSRPEGEISSFLAEH